MVVLRLTVTCASQMAVLAVVVERPKDPTKAIFAPTSPRSKGVETAISLLCHSTSPAHQAPAQAPTTSGEEVVQAVVVVVVDHVQVHDAQHPHHDLHQDPHQHPRLHQEEVSARILESREKINGVRTTRKCALFGQTT